MNQKKSRSKKPLNWNKKQQTYKHESSILEPKKNSWKERWKPLWKAWSRLEELVASQVWRDGMMLRMFFPFGGLLGVFVYKNYHAY